MFFVRYCLANTMGTMAIGYNYFETLEIQNYCILIFDFKTVCYNMNSTILGPDTYIFKTRLAVTGSCGSGHC